MAGKFKFSWKCPVCKKIHNWEWDENDRIDIGDKITMFCKNCNSHTKMECRLEEIVK